MSFCGDVKREITSHQLSQPCCVEAASYGVACFGRYFDTKGLVLHTESEFVAQWAQNCYEKAGIQGSLIQKGNGASPIYEFAVKDPFEVEKMLALFGHTGEETALRLNPGNFECAHCFAAFVSAAFLCGGVVVAPEKSYSLEFVGRRYGLMKDFEALLRQQGFAPGQARRNGAYVLYFRSSEAIEDMLTFMGATSSALEIMNLKILRDFRNRANRITNCETANIDKIVAANRQVLAAVEVLERTGALAAMPEPLRQAARLRQAHPASSLADLAAVAQPPVSKSGLSHRFRKLCQKAAEIQAHDTEKSP